MKITKEQIAKLKDAYEGNKEELKCIEDYIRKWGAAYDGLTDATESFEQGYNNALEFVFRVLEDNGEEDFMEYEMKVVITKDGDEKTYILDCGFGYDEEQYGNGYSASIEGKDFYLQYFDIRYDRSFNKSNKSKWLEEWARGYWTGENGAWSIKEIDIVPIKEQ